MWNAVWFLSVWALTSAPRRSASRLICWQSRERVPLKAMCSMKWLMPLSARTLVLAAAAHEDADRRRGQCGSRTTTTRTPLSSVVITVSASSAWAPKEGIATQ